MGVLTEEQLDHIWNEKGLKHRFARLHKLMLSHGLGPMAVRKDLFLRDIRERLTDFFVKGVKEDASGRQEFPAD